MLLTESLGGADRERAHQHIERCEACAAEWADTKLAWSELEALPVLSPPAALRERFLSEADSMQPRANVVSLSDRRPMFRRYGQIAAALVLVVSGFVGGRAMTRSAHLPTVAEPQPTVAFAAETVLPASAVDPSLAIDPRVKNVQFVPRANGQIAMTFDMNSQVVVEGQPDDMHMARLVSNVISNRNYSAMTRSSALQWVRDTYATAGAADPELVTALVQLVRDDSHEGVRIRAVEALSRLSPSSAPAARLALVEALRNDPNPAVRLRAIDALAAIAGSGADADESTLDTLRDKASQEDENPYVRVKAAEALGSLEL